MTDIVRTNTDGHQEVRTGLGWRKVLSPSSSEAATALPLIDISQIAHPSLERRKSVGRDICDAAITSGFFYVSNHGVPSNSIESIFRESKRFFHDLSLDEKMKYDTQKHEHYYGYYPINLDPTLPAGASKSLTHHRSVADESCKN